MEWAEYASHSHNGYIDTALSNGAAGLALLIAVLVITPLRNFHAADRGGNDGPLAMALLRIWLFGLYLSSLESFFLDSRRSDLVHVSAGGIRLGTIWRAFGSKSELSQQCLHRLRDIQPPAIRNRTAPAPTAI